MIERIDEIVLLALQQTWQVAAVAMVVATLVWLFGRGRAHLAYLLWLLVLIKCLTPPLWSSPVGVFSWVGVRWERLADEPTEAAGPEPMARGAAATVASARSAPSAAPAVVVGAIADPTAQLPPIDLSGRGNAFESSWSLRWPFWLAAIWIAGAAFALTVMTARHIACRWLLSRSCRPADPALQELMQRVAEQVGLHRKVRLLVTSRSLGPAVVGWFHPAVLLPESLLGERRGLVQAILAHELIHLRRGDTWVAFWQLAVQVVWWFHPLVWWANRRMVRERERCCDEEVVAALGCDPADYAQGLIDVLKMKRRLRPLFALPGVRRVDITRARIHDIMRKDREFKEKTPWWCWPVVLTAGLLLLPGSTLVFRTVSDQVVKAAEQGGPSTARKRRKAAAGQGQPETPSHRNNVSSARNLPTTWNDAKQRNVRWTADLGSQTYGTPVVADGRVLVGTNNAQGRVKRLGTADMGCLQCYDVATGEFIWQHASEKLPSGRVHDWPKIGITSTPLVEGHRVWYVTNRNEVVCLDLQGFRDDENDGPFTDEANESPDEADVIWRFDLMKQLNVRQHNAVSCSVTIQGDLLFVSTSHGVNEAHSPPRAAPCFVAMDKSTGEVHWTDQSPGLNILHGQWSSPAVGVLAGQPQVVFAGGDGWVYSFRADKGKAGRPQKLWEFDANPKESRWVLGRAGTRNNILASPVIYEGAVYVVVGQDPEHGEGQGAVHCIDPSRRGDVSTHLVLNQGELAPRRRRIAADEKLGDKIVANPNSALIWTYRSSDRNGDGKLEFEETMHRGIGSPAIKNNLLFVADYSGCLHCLDAKTGRVNWTHDLLAACWSTPLIADDRVYVADEDGDVAVLALSRNKSLIEEVNVGVAIYSTPVASHDTLYIAAKNRLLAISKKGESSKSKSQRKRRKDKQGHSSWSSPRGDARNSGVAETTLAPKLRLRWRNKVKGRSFSGSPVIAKGLVFTCDLDGRVTARRLIDGKQTWSHDLMSASSASPMVADDRLYVGDSQGNVYCLRAKDGRRIWVYRTGGEISGAAQRVKDRIVIASEDGVVYGLDEKTGRLAWKYATDDQIRTTPAVVGDSIVIAGCDGQLHVLNGLDGSRKATFDIGGPTGSTVAISGAVGVVGNEQGELYQYALDSGKQIWKATEAFGGLPLRSSAAIDNKLVVIGSRSKRIVALQRATGRLLWQTSVRGSVDASPVIVGKTVFCACNDGRLYGLDRATGKIVWEFEAGGDFQGSAAVAEGALVVAGGDGVIFCFED